MRDNRYVGTPVRWGVGLGIALCVWTLFVHALGFYTTRVRYVTVWDTAATILPVAAIGGALWAVRSRSLPVPLRLTTAVGVGWLVGAISLLFVVPFFWYYHHVVNPRWVQFLVDDQVRSLAEAHAAQTVIDQRVQQIRLMGTDRAQVTGALMGTTLLSLVVSALMFVIIRLGSRRRTH